MNLYQFSLELIKHSSKLTVHASKQQQFFVDCGVTCLFEP